MIRSLVVFALVLLGPLVHAQGLEIEQGVTPEERPKIRISLTNTQPERQAVLSRAMATGISVAYGQRVSFAAWQEICDLPCTLSVEPRSETLQVSGYGWGRQLPLHKYAGPEVNLQIRPGRPVQTWIGRTLITLGGGVAIAGLGFMLSDLMLQRVLVDDDPPPHLMKLGLGFTLGGLGTGLVGAGFTIRGSTRILEVP